MSLSCGGIFELDFVAGLESRLTEVGAGGATEGISEIAFAAAGLDGASLKVALGNLALLEPNKYFWESYTYSLRPQVQFSQGLPALTLSSSPQNFCTTWLVKVSSFIKSSSLIVPAAAPFYTK